MRGNALRLHNVPIGADDIHDRQAYEFSYALYLARQLDRESAQMIVQAAEVLWLLSGHQSQARDYVPKNTS